MFAAAALLATAFAAAPSGATDAPVGTSVVASAEAVTPTIIGVVSDYGYASHTQVALKDLVDGWDPDYVVTTGDNVQTSALPGEGVAKYDFAVGRLFCRYMKGSAPGTNCPSGGTASVNRFFPATGNHDWTDGGIENYKAYFDLPGAGATSTSPTGSELYYDVVLGPVHVFVIDSEPMYHEARNLPPAQRVVTQAQRTWLQAALQASTSPFNVVTMHDPAYGTSASYGSAPFVQWPYAEWGADLVLNGHAAVYERVMRDGIAYVTNGLGGGDGTGFVGSKLGPDDVRYTSDLIAASRLRATPTSLRLEMITEDGVVHDTYDVPHDAPPERAGGSFVGLTPSRVLDTRTQPPCVSSTPRSLVVAPSAGVPADAAAVALNVTVDRPSAEGYLTVYPSDSARPDASNVNYTAGAVVPNLVTTKVGADGRIRLFTSAGCPRVTVDVLGYYAAGAPEPGGLVAVTPTRALNTRDHGPCVSGSGRELEIAPNALAGVPSDAAAVALNVTVTRPGAPGYLTVFPTGSARPTASNLNFRAGQTVANHVTVKVGDGGRITLFASGGCPHVIVDIAGYFTAGTPGPGGFVANVPNRVVDTREVGGCVSGARRVTVAPTTGVPGDAEAVVMNVTVDKPSAPGYLTVYPAGAARPTASNLNFRAGQTVPNAVVSKVGVGGAVDVYASGGCPQVMVDVVGYHVGGG